MRRSRAVAGAAMIVLLAACGSSAPTVAPSQPVAPSPTVGPGSASVDPTAPVASPGSVPPEAALIAAVGDPVQGQLGSYTWRETGSDSPWLPGAPVIVDPTRSLRFGLSFEAPVAGWDARYATPGEPMPGRPVGLDNGAAPLEVELPPAGEWTVALTISYGQGLGSATYYWLVRVP